MAKLFIGIDLGGTNIKIGAFDSDLNLIDRISVPNEDTLSPEDVVKRICQSVKSLIKNIKASLDDVAAAGIGSPGPVNLEEGIVLAAPNLPFTECGSVPSSMGTSIISLVSAICCVNCSIRLRVNCTLG